MQDPHASNGGQAPEGRIITEGHLRHFINARRHGVIDAVAGAGKSHQLEEALSMLPEEARVLLVAFNDKNAKDMKVIIARRGRRDTCQASTFHKWAFRLLRRRNPDEKVRVEEYKFKRFLCDRVLSGPGRWQRAKAAEDLANIAQNTNCGLGEAELESLREQYGLGLQLSPDEQRRVVRAVSAELNQMKTNIADMPVTAVDFNDMIWLPAISDDILLEISFDWIFLDECQDFSPVQLLLLRRVLQANSKVRVLAAGDPHQSIYGFRGVQDSMPELRSILNEYGGVDEFTLPVCRRCPASHLRLARLVVQHIQPLPGREEGVLRHLLAATWPRTLEEMAPGDYVLCRQVKPLVQLACDMVKEQRPARIVGEKSIKSGLLAFFSDQRNATVDQVKQSMQDSHKTVKAELLAKGDTKQLGIYEQFYETALLLLEELESPQQAIKVRGTLQLQLAFGLQLTSCPTVSQRHLRLRSRARRDQLQHHSQDQGSH
jgi:hypothetical protein